MSPTEVLVALAILVGLVGVIVPILPGLVLVLAAILVWAIDEGPATGWTVFAVAAAVLIVGLRGQVRRPEPPAQDDRHPVLDDVVRRGRSASSASSSSRWSACSSASCWASTSPSTAGSARRGVALDQGGAARRRRQHPDRARGRRAGRARLGRRRRRDLMAVLLSLLAALSYGLADFCGGMASKRASAWGVALVAPADRRRARPGRPRRARRGTHGRGLWWGAAAGVGNGFGTAFLYRGLSVGPDGRGRSGLRRRRGRDPGRGRRRCSASGPRRWSGSGSCWRCPAIWLVARDPAGSPRRGRPGGVVDGALAGARLRLPLRRPGPGRRRRRPAAARRQPGRWPALVIVAGGDRAAAALAAATRSARSAARRPASSAPPPPCASCSPPARATSASPRS